MKQLGLSLVSKPPWLVLLISVSVSIFAGYVTDQQAHKTGQAHFERQVEKLGFDIAHQLATYISLLRAGVGVFYASEEVTRAEWQLFVRTLEVERFYPGIQGIGYAAYLRAAEKSHFEQSVRTEGYEQFSIAPAGARDIYTPVTYLEPFTWRNQRAFGYDMYSEPVRRQAMERARDTGEASISGHVILVQETDEDVQAGFLMYLPVYRGFADPGQLPLRRANILGFVYAPFRMDSLLSAITQGNPGQLSYRILDQGPLAQVLYNSDPVDALALGVYQQTLPLLVGGREWSLQVHSSAAFDATQYDNSAIWVLAAGLLDSLLLFGIVLSLVAHRKSAQQHAERMANQLSLSEKFRHMADFAPTALVSLDPEGRIELSNRQAQILFACPPEELSGALLSRYVPTQALSGAAELPVTAECVGQDGRATPVEIAQQTGSVNDQTYEIVALVDTTERQRQEELLRRKTADLQQFVYAISHDLKSPLVAITGLADLLAEEPAVAGQAQALRLIDRIVANSRHMEQLLTDLLDLSRVTHIPLALEFIDINGLFEQLVQSYGEAVHAVSGSLVCVPQSEGFWGHKTLILQLLGNLISNAIKYRSAQRALRVEVSLTAREQGGVRLSVADNGIGIDPGWHQKVFNVFTRKESGEVPGSGIGLAICLAVAERHQGRMWLESEVGQGTTFFVDFPGLKES